MNKSTILIVDDEKAIHIVLKAMLHQEFNLEFASDGQQAIDILTEKPINLVLLDIQMPDLSGLELLESLMIDSALNQVPIIIFTGKVTEERERHAKNLGAAGFVGKDNLLSEVGKDTLKALIKENLNEDYVSAGAESDYKMFSKLIIKSLLKDAVKNDFFHAGRKLALNLMKYFQIDYISFWAIQDHKPNMLMCLGDTQPEDFGPDQIKSEHAFKELCESKTSYLTNNASSQKKGIFANEAMKSGLSSEIGVPIFKINRQTLVEHKMRIPESTPIFGFIILKRNQVFTSKEFKVLRQTIIYCGTILWALFQNLFTK